MDATNGVVSHSQQLQQIIAPEGSSISTTAGGQKVITTPDGKQMIVKVAANGQQMVVGTIDPVRYGWNLKIERFIIKSFVGFFLLFPITSPEKKFSRKVKRAC